ncbi:MAG: hypothetical protein ABI277_05370 [Burkholderiaceae bacterium]
MKEARERARRAERSKWLAPASRSSQRDKASYPDWPSRAEASAHAMLACKQAHLHVPAGRPGAALLIPRASVGVLLVEGVSGPFLKLVSPWLLAAPIGIAIALALALALALGLVTPLVAKFAILLEVTTLVTMSMDLHAVHVCAVLDAFANRIPRSGCRLGHARHPQRGTPGNHQGVTGPPLRP